MKSFVAYMLLVGFLGVAVFGAFGMGHAVENHMSGCIASLAQGVDCGAKADPIDSAAFHLAALRNFTLATVDSIGMTMFALAIAAIALFLFISAKETFFLMPAQSAVRERLTHGFYTPQEQRAHLWLALHENSPALLAR